MAGAIDTPIEKEFIAEGRKNRPGRKISVSAITVHNTDNANRGADATAHSRFVRETGYYMLNGEKHWVSWHFTVDDSRVIQHLPLDEVAYHAGSAANGSSIAIEICMNSDNDQPLANRRAAGLVATLLKASGLTLQDVKKHKDWTGKNCPSLLLRPKQWETFLGLVNDGLESVNVDVMFRQGDLEDLLGARDRPSPEGVENFDIDHHLLNDAIALEPVNDETALGRTLEEALASVVTNFSSASQTTQADGGRLFFPHGINEITLKLKPSEIELIVKGPESGAAGLEADADVFDSVPEDSDPAVMRAAPPVTAKLNAPTATLYGTHTPDRLYGIAQTIDAIEAVAAAFHDRHPGYRVGIGDISKRGGGPISGHASHQKGVDVDVRLIRRDGAERATRYQDASYSRELTQDLINLFRENRMFPVKVVFFNDPHAHGVSEWPNHDNHLHVRFDIARAASSAETE